MKKVLLGVLFGVLFSAIVGFGIIAYPHFMKQYFPSHTQKGDTSTAKKNTPQPTKAQIESAEKSMEIKTAGTVMDDYLHLNNLVAQKMQPYAGIFSAETLSDVQTEESFLDKDIDNFKTINSPAQDTPAYNDFMEVIDDIQQMETNLNDSLQQKDVDKLGKYTDMMSDVKIKYNNFIMATE